jgi:hypothetical protein
MNLANALQRYNAFSSALVKCDDALHDLDVCCICKCSNIFFDFPVVLSSRMTCLSNPNCSIKPGI